VRVRLIGGCLGLFMASANVLNLVFECFEKFCLTGELAQKVCLSCLKAWLSVAGNDSG
jgi:hypothetical protein